MSRSDTKPRSRTWLPSLRRPGEGASTSPSRSRGLPEDLQQEGVRRLSAMCFGLVVVGVISTIVRQVSKALGAQLLLDNVLVVELGVGALSALAFILGLAARRGWLSTRTIVRLGLAFEVFLAFAIAAIERTISSFGSKARQLGNYQLVSQLGRGGMGEVWRAKHQRLVRPAAIKLIWSENLANSSASMRRFELEAQATASLRSPHTVELYDFGVSRDGAFYYAMEYLQGIDLDALVDRYGPMPPGRVAVILRQVCQSLAEAHAAGLTHRDIKPANLVLCHLGIEGDFVKVLDFGLVKPEVHDLAETTGLSPWSSEDAHGWWQSHEKEILESSS